MNIGAVVIIMLCAFGIGYISGELLSDRFYHKMLDEQSEYYLCEMRKLVDRIKKYKEKEKCPKCKHFVGCDPYKTMFYKTSGESCEEFEEDKT